uniref:Methyltransferase FkbM domain-containing protein n=1 Tax=viral metagenome TaxID=1070528 RepID=A0A6C0BVM8_9ZZZZ
MATKLCLGNDWNNLLKLCNGKICIDIGANNGFVTSLMLENGATKIYCIEPGNANCKQLQDKYKNDERIIIYKIGCSDEKKILKNVTWLNAWMIGDPKTINFPVSPGACDVEGYQLVDIELDTVDNLFTNTDEEISFMKIDVDGYDYKVLKGSINLINRCRPIIIIELSCYYDVIEKNSVPEFIKFVKKNNYTFVDLFGKIVFDEYIIKEFPYHSSCDIFLCPTEKIDYFMEKFHG